MTFKRFEEIKAWQTARKLSRKIEKVISSSSLAKDYKLRDQMRASVNSMMANIAEGHSRRSDREFTHFLFTAKSSAAEFQSHLYSANDRGYIDDARRSTRQVDWEDGEDWEDWGDALLSYALD